MTRALRRRGIDATAAALAAESGVTVFRVAFARWIAEGEARSLPEIQRAVLAELRFLVSAD
jgi:NifB/MoaA-like Fe-S oxidoreductase